MANNNQSRHKNEQDFSHDTWRSLLELLTPAEFFVTVNSFPIWRRHLAWAKPDGKELRDILTMRFSSTMVLLSLLLGTEMGVLFNPNETTRAMRDAMAAEAYGDFKFWIGVTIWMSACVTVIGLVGTFAAWGMVSSISAENAHCLLRSSIGQYVASQPAHFVIAALYLFLLWLIMFLFEMLHGPLRIVLVVMAAYLFFQVVVPLSAFGRLIMHTGAMSSKRVLDPAFEKCLLPSGLHASLLIKATHRKRARVSALSQYRTSTVARESSHGNTVSSNSNKPSYGSMAAATTSTDAPLQESVPATANKRESVQDVLPRPSVLNSMHTSNLQAVVERVLALKARQSAGLDREDHDTSRVGGINESSDDRPLIPNSRQASAGLVSRSSMMGPLSPLSTIDERESVASSVAATDQDRTSLRPSMDISSNDNAENVSPPELSPTAAAASSSSNSSHPRQPQQQHRVSGLRSSVGMLIRGHMKRTSRQQQQQEWQEENDVRDLYDLPPPAEPLDDDNDDDENDVHLEDQFNALYLPRVSFPYFPRPSFWKNVVLSDDTLEETTNNPIPSENRPSRSETQRLLPEEQSDDFL